MGDVTGGDLYKLWKVANVALPHVAAVYTDANKTSAGSDGKAPAIFETKIKNQYGANQVSPISAAYELVSGEFQHILAQTATNLIACSGALNLAIEAFIVQDEAAGGDLRTAYRDLLAGKVVDGKRWHDPTDPPINPPPSAADPGTPDEPDSYTSPGDRKAEDPEEARRRIERIEREIREMEDK